MAQNTFGNRLAEARRRRGLSLEQVHAQLRVSPIILTAFETGDFARMPLKGHARNMVSSYARYLGLDSEELTAQFLSEYHAFENHVSHRDSLPKGFATVEPTGVDPAPADRYAGSSQYPNPSSGGQGTRSMWNKPIPKSELNRGYDSRSSSAQRMANAASRRRPVPREGTTTVAANRNAGGYSRSGSLPRRISGTLFKSPAVLIIILVIVLVLLLALWAMAANSCKKKENEVIPIVTTTTPGEGEGSATDPTTPLVPGDEEPVDPNIGPFELVVEPAAGTGPWTEVIVDGETVFHDALTEKKTWTVTDTCSLSTGQPGNLTVTRNGEGVDWEIDSGSGTGSLQLEVNKAPTNEQTTS